MHLPKNLTTTSSKEHLNQERTVVHLAQRNKWHQHPEHMAAVRARKIGYCTRTWLGDRDSPRMHQMIPSLSTIRGKRIDAGKGAIRRESYIALRYGSEPKKRSSHRCVIEQLLR